jgi:hypothetical protein
VLKRDPDDDSIITDIELVEISLVDRPANPECKIELFKADSKKPDDSEDDHEDSEDDPEDDDEDDKPKKKKSAKTLFGEDTIETKLAKLEAELEESKEEFEELLQDHLDEMSGAVACGLIDKTWQESGLTVDDLQKVLATATKADREQPMYAFVCKHIEATLTTLDILAKAGARHNTSDMDSIQAIHDHTEKLGAQCDKEAAVTVGDLAKAEERYHALREVNARQAALITKLNTELTKLKAEPETPKVHSGKVVTKEMDSKPTPTQADDAEILDKMTPQERVIHAFKKAHANPIWVR